MYVSVLYMPWDVCPCRTSLSQLRGKQVYVQAGSVWNRPLWAIAILGFTMFASPSCLEPRNVGKCSNCNLCFSVLLLYLELRNVQWGTFAACAPPYYSTWESRNVQCYFALLLGICSFCADNDLLHVEFLCYKHASAERILGLLVQFFYSDPYYSSLIQMV
jgi:hypothetical protein